VRETPGAHGVSGRLADALTAACNTPGTGLAEAALVIARLEYAQLSPAPYLAQLDAMGEAARQRVEQQAEATGDRSARGRARAVGAYLFEQEQFTGNRESAADPRNSCLNQVLERRTGLPITLSVVYIEVARRAGLAADGVSFPGHFLVRCPEDEPGESLIIDPFNRGALLTPDDCRRLLGQHAGPDVPFRTSLLVPATRQQIVVRMLFNLKHLYVHMRSFPQAYQVTELLVAMNPSALSELRDRGLLAYHLNDVSGALHDLQAYLRLEGLSDPGGEEENEERQQIWEHVKMLRRRVASLN
jgi:regulator of sirC expression with transglutaminase-like and TPR domain